MSIFGEVHETYSTQDMRCLGSKKLKFDAARALGGRDVRNLVLYRRAFKDMGPHAISCGTSLTS